MKPSRSASGSIRTYARCAARVPAAAVEVEHDRRRLPRREGRRNVDERGARTAVVLDRELVAAHRAERDFARLGSHFGPLRRGSARGERQGEERELQ